MRFMVLLKANEVTERGDLPTKEMLEEMIDYSEELASKGAMLAGEGLQPSSKGARISFSGAEPGVTNGPFPEPRELIAGFWIIQAGSLEEAINLVKRAPLQGSPEYGGAGEVEIRQIFEADDFGSAFTDELRRREETLGEMIDRQREEAA
jgi:hypothetical protein